MNQQQAGFYSTKELSKLFQVDESTVKRWTNGSKLKCFRTPGGHRKYTSEHVLDFIRTYHYELDANRKIAALQKQKNAAPVPEYSADIMRELFFSQVLRGSGDQLVDVLHRSYLSHIPLLDIYESIIGRSAAELFGMHNSGMLTRDELHAAASAIMESIMQFRLLTPRNLPNGKIALCASLTHGVQDIILLCASHFLEMSGWKVYYLGPNTPAGELADAVKKYSPDSLCIPAEYLPEFAGGRLADVAMNGPADCMVFDYFHEVPQGNAGYRPYRILSHFAELSEHIKHTGYPALRVSAL